jgi:hypothetical protein
VLVSTGRRIMDKDKWEIYHSLSHLELGIKDLFPKDGCEPKDCDWNKVSGLMCDAISRLQEAQGEIERSFDPVADTP